MNKRYLLYTPDGEPIGFVLVYVLHLRKFFQNIMVWLQLIFFRPLLIWLFNLQGITLYIIPRSQERGFRNADEFFAQLKGIITGAKEIKIAVGEMGHALMESPLVDALEFAYHNNQAEIEIVFGPRVDPKTQRVFKLAEKGIVNLFKMPEYRRHHFMLITSLSNEVVLIDEGIHDETLWVRDQAGNPIPVMTSKARYYYVVNGSKRIVTHLNAEYELRKKSSVFTKTHPMLSSTPHQEYSPLKIVIRTLINFPVRFVIQPLGVFFDFPFEFSRNISYSKRDYRGVRSMPERLPPPQIRITKTGARV